MPPRKRKLESKQVKPRKKSTKCGSMTYKCEKCDHEVELQITAKTEKLENAQTQKASVKQEREMVLEYEMESKSEVEKSQIVCKVPDLPAIVQISHSGFWITNKEGKHVSTTDKDCDRNSVLLDKQCMFYVWKLAFRHVLLSKGIIIPSHIDNANLVPHLKIRENPKDPLVNMTRFRVKNV